jgi:Uma2 family endonuclease
MSTAEVIEQSKPISPARRLTTDEFLALPEEEGITLELIDGELKERPMTTRSPKHSKTLAKVSAALDIWLDGHPELGGDVVVGDVRCRLSQEPETIVGIDAAWFSSEVAARLEQDDRFYDGAPIVAVEVLSPTDTHEDVTQKILRYLEAGTKQVWIADPDLQTVTIHRGNGDPTFFHRGQVLDAEPELPGFRIQTALLFSGKRAEQQHEPS